MRKYIAELTSTGLYTLRIAKEIVSSTTYLLNGNKVSDYLFILDDGNSFLYKATDSNKLFDNLENCQSFIENMNSL